MTNFLEAALFYHKNGIHVIPVGENKRPQIPQKFNYKWKQFQEAQSEEDVRELFAQPCFGIAVLTGVNGLEVIDLDCKYDLDGNLFLNYIETVESFDSGIALDQVPLASTKNGGFHFFYRSDHIEGNLKLGSRYSTQSELDANPHDKIKVLVETRGTGGYVLVAPTPGYSMDNLQIPDAPVLDKDQRDAFILSGRYQNQVIDSTMRDRNEARMMKSGESFADLAPWDDFNNRSSIPDILEKNGWKEVRRRGTRVDYCRPGKDKGVSGNYDETHNMFYSFTSSSVLPQNKGLTAYGLYTYFECNGDFKRSATNLYDLGYGSRYITSASELIKDVDEVWQKLQSTKFDWNVKPAYPDFVLKCRVDMETFDIAAFGMMVMISGLPKSMKTTLLRAILAAGLGNKEVVNMSLDLQGRGILDMDTEQPDVFFDMNVRSTLDMAGIGANSPLMDSYRLRRFDPKERVQMIEVGLQKTPNVGVLVLDGILDLVEDYNDTTECTRLVNTVMRWTTDYSLLAFPVLHLGKTTGSMVGVLGSIFARKCDAQINMVKEENEAHTNVHHTLARTKAFRTYQFHRDDDGRPHVGVKFDQNAAFPAASSTFTGSVL